MVPSTLIYEVVLHYLLPKQFAYESYEDGDDDVEDKEESWLLQ